MPRPARPSRACCSGRTASRTATWSSRTPKGAASSDGEERRTHLRRSGTAPDVVGQRQRRLTVDRLAGHQRVGAVGVRDHPAAHVPASSSASPERADRAAELGALVGVLEQGPAQRRRPRRRSTAPCWRACSSPAVLGPNGSSAWNDMPRHLARGDGPRARPEGEVRLARLGDHAGHAGGDVGDRALVEQALGGCGSSRASTSFHVRPGTRERPRRADPPGRPAGRAGGATAASAIDRDQQRRPSAASEACASRSHLRRRSVRTVRYTSDALTTPSITPGHRDARSR